MTGTRHGECVSKQDRPNREQARQQSHKDPAIVTGAAKPDMKKSDYFFFLL